MSTPSIPPTQAAIALARRRIYVVIGALMLGLLLAALDQTIVSTALPTIVADLHGASHLSWVVTAYLLAATASTPVWGKLGDQYGRKGFFQASIVLFLIGSTLSGLSQSMLELILFRAIQGLGGGGLIVGAQAIIGDVVPPRERGKYQGLFGAVFGVTSILGPLLGGIFVDDLSWRWIFYVNLPVGVVALTVIAIAVPNRLTRTHHTIDYLGTAMLALAATSFVVYTSLGGTSYPWFSPPLLVVLVLGVVATAGWALVDRRAREPVLPLHLFTNRTFAAACAIGFVVGLAMFGALVFLPLYLQDVRGINPTSSGIHLLPLMGGFLLMSIGSGQIISRTGRYRRFPIFGTFSMTVGLGLFSTITASTTTLDLSLYMFVLGIGLGSVMQVLVMAVQNAVPYSELGTATSGSTFFRSIGGSFGTAIFGAIFSNVLVGNLAHYLRGVSIPHSVLTIGVTPRALRLLSAPARHGLAVAYAHSLATVFRVAVPIGAVAFALSFLLPDVELRRGVPDGGARGSPPARAGTPVGALD